MNKKVYPAPLGMSSRDLYCCDCGAQLEKHAITRIVKKGDPDYKKHRKIGRRYVFGDVEITEYEFKCPSCEKTISYDEQGIIEKIQNRLNKQVLSQEEIDANIEQAKAEIHRKSRISGMIYKIIFFAVIAFLIYRAIKTGEFSFKFYF